MLIYAYSPKKQKKNRNNMSETQTPHIEHLEPQVDAADQMNSPESRLDEIDSLFHDTDLTTISIRRHGAYERSPDSVQRGQLTKETMPAVKEAASEWVGNLPEDVKLDFVTSPTGMPATGPTGEALMPARARMTGALYGGVLRERFGEDFTHLARNERSEATQGLPANETLSPRTTDQRLGDLFEYTDKEESAHIPTFFKELSGTYGGMTPEFWQNYIRGTLPENVQEAFIAGGGDTALEKSIMATDWILEHAGGQDDSEKHVALAISHEEVIGSLGYQIGEYLRHTKQISEEAVEQIESEKFSYNEGYDLHVDADGVAAIKIGDVTAVVDLLDFRQYMQSKQDQLTAE